MLYKFTVPVITGRPGVNVMSFVAVREGFMVGSTEGPVCVMVGSALGTGRLQDFDLGGEIIPVGQ